MIIEAEVLPKSRVTSKRVHDDATFLKTIIYLRRTFLFDKGDKQKRVALNFM